MQKYLVLYKCPVHVLDSWMQTPKEEMEREEQKMKQQWNEWSAKNAAHIVEVAGAGKTKSVNASGVSDIRNDIMLYSVVEVESHDAAAEIFKNHPHLQIPESTIEIMTINNLGM